MPDEKNTYVTRQQADAYYCDTVIDSALKKIVAGYIGDCTGTASLDEDLKAVAALRVLLVSLWNERGKLDKVAVQSKLENLAGWGASKPYVNAMHDGISVLDR